MSKGREPTNEDLVPVTTVYNPVEAEIIAGKLRSSGIDCAIRHDALSVVYGLTVDGCGKQEILVRQSDLAEATAAMGRPDEDTEDDDPREGDDPGDDDPRDDDDPAR